MKKFLLAGILAASFVPQAAMAQIDVEIGMDTRTYFGFMSQDTAPGEEERNFDMLRESEVHFNAEGKTDNDLTYGIHIEVEVDGGDGFAGETSYFYLSSSYGKVELGSNDGVSYKLQVAAPSADPNIDGVRAQINPVNYALNDILGVNDIAITGNGDGFDYDNNFSSYNEKISYYTPVWDGLQLGISYTPDQNDPRSTSGLLGFTPDDVANTYGDVIDAAIRYEHKFNEDIKMKAGAGYTHASLEADNGTGFDDYYEWNAAIDFDIGDFGIGAVYTENNNGLDVRDEDQIMVVGVDYKIGSYKFGASYYHRDDDAAGTANLATDSVETNRYTAGVTYKIADGFDVRGSVSFIENDIPTVAGDDTDAASALIGFNINF